MEKFFLYSIHIVSVIYYQQISGYSSISNLPSFTWWHNLPGHLAVDSTGPISTSCHRGDLFTCYSPVIYFFGWQSLKWYPLPACQATKTEFPKNSVRVFLKWNLTMPAWQPIMQPGKKLECGRDSCFWINEFRNNCIHEFRDEEYFHIQGFFARRSGFHLKTLLFQTNSTYLFCIQARWHCIILV